MKDKIVSAEQAVRLIRDGDALCTSGFVGIGTPDGLIGEKTRAAIRAEQGRLGMQASGRAGQKLLAALRAAR